MVFLVLICTVRPYIISQGYGSVVSVQPAASDKQNAPRLSTKSHIVQHVRDLQLRGGRGCPVRRCSIHPCGFSRYSWIKPWATCSAFVAEPAVSRRLGCCPPEIPSSLNYFAILRAYDLDNIRVTLRKSAGDTKLRAAQNCNLEGPWKPTENLRDPSLSSQAAWGWLVIQQLPATTCRELTKML